MTASVQVGRGDGNQAPILSAEYVKRQIIRNTPIKAIRAIENKMAKCGLFYAGGINPRNRAFTRVSYGTLRDGCQCVIEEALNGLGMTKLKPDDFTDELIERAKMPMVGDDSDSGDWETDFTIVYREQGDLVAFLAWWGNEDMWQYYLECM